MKLWCALRGHREEITGKGANHTHTLTYYRCTRCLATLVRQAVIFRMPEEIGRIQQATISRINPETPIFTMNDGFVSGVFTDCVTSIRLIPPGASHGQANIRKA